jgi:hypothetical protein
MHDNKNEKNDKLQMFIILYTNINIIKSNEKNNNNYLWFFK